MKKNYNNIYNKYNDYYLSNYNKISNDTTLVLQEKNSKIKYEKQKNIALNKLKKLKSRIKSNNDNSSSNNDGNVGITLTEEITLTENPEVVDNSVVDEVISDEEFELEEKASEILDDIYASALEFTENKLWDYDFFEGFSE